MITSDLMRVKVPPPKLTGDSLSAHAEPTRSTAREIGRAKLGTGHNQTSIADDTGANREVPW